MSIKVEVSVGELLDKMSILGIKLDKIKDPTKLNNVKKEFHVLTSRWESSRYNESPLDDTIAALKKVNSQLWDIEDEIREHERKQCFDQHFIALARAVYIKNDERARIKQEINVRTGSELIEEKSYNHN